MAQHTSPCSECCFRRDIKPGLLGGSPPQTYIGQTQGPFWIPCHCPADYADKDTEYGSPECAGSAIYRANLGIDGVMPEGILKLPPDKEKCFSSHAEFLAHHTGCSLEIAEAFLKEFTPNEMLEAELMDRQMKIIRDNSKLRRVE